MDKHNSISGSKTQVTGQPVTGQPVTGQPVTGQLVTGHTEHGSQVISIVHAFHDLQILHVLSLQIIKLNR